MSNDPEITSSENDIAPGVRARELRWQYSRSSGPGGQNVNKVSTRAEFWVKVDDLQGLHEEAKFRLRASAGAKLTSADEIHIACDEHRSQSANREGALARLRELIIQAQHRPKRRKKTRPSFGSKQRRIESKKHRGSIKQSRGSRDFD